MLLFNGQITDLPAHVVAQEHALIFKGLQLRGVVELPGIGGPLVVVVGPPAVEIVAPKLFGPILKAPAPTAHIVAHVEILIAVVGHVMTIVNIGVLEPTTPSSSRKSS